MQPEMVHSRSVAVALERIAAGEGVEAVEDDYQFPRGMLAAVRSTRERALMDAGIQELAQAVADRILPRIVAEARARGVELAPPKEHPPVTFMSVAVVHVVEVETKESPRVKDPGDRPAREPLAGPPRRLPRKLRN
jgi:hypothetical protein